MGLAFAAAFASIAAAQSNSDGQVAASGNAKPGTTEGATRNMPDMRLWSFGDCDNKFPYVNTDEHKECVRVVGSEEARDARAYRVCETSNPRDREEVARCKSTYKANKDRSAQSGYVPNAAPQAQAAPTAEDLQKVRAIATAAVERDRAEKAAAAAASDPAAEAPPQPDPPPPEPEESGPSTLVIALCAAALLLGGAVFVQRRKQSGMLSTR
jgi:hypothetical protein